jgi:hypothetical protein
VRDYHPFYSDIAAEFILSLPKRKGRKLLDICHQLAMNPFVRSDYSVKDTDGRDIEHIIIDGFLIAYWADHAVCKVMIVEVDAVR